MIVCTDFKEHPVVDYRLKDPHKYAISGEGFDVEPDFRKNNRFDLEAYNECLIHKLSTIPSNEYSAFLEYQCELLEEPSHWLKQLELLIDQNAEIFESKGRKFMKLYALITVMLEKFKISQANIPKFEFKIVKSKLDKLQTDEEKLKMLIEEKIEYLQHNIHNINALQDSYIKAIELEMLKISDLQALNGHKKGHMTSLTFPKLKLNGNTNIIVTAFYQGMEELKIDGKPYIEGTIQEVADAICSIFVDKNGNELSISTVRTILDKGKHDKRAKGKNRIILSENTDN